MRAVRLIHALTLLVLALFTVAYLAVVSTHLSYTFDIDFLEDDILVEAWRFAQGLPVFVPPNADFVPHAYAPLYMLLSAGLIKLGGVGFLAMRALSTAAALATAVMLAWAGYAISRRWLIALIAPGLFFAGYALTGAQYDLARVDSLMFALVVAGTLVGVVNPSSRRMVALSALCLALAFFAKQTALVFGAGMVAYLFVVQRRQAWWFAPLWGALLAVPLVVMDRLTGGWSTIYLFEVPQSDPILASRIVAYLRHDVLVSLGPLCLCALMAAVVMWRRPRERVPLAVGWLGFTLLALADSGWMRARLGGNLNSLMPAYTFLCLAPVIALNNLPSSAIARTLVFLLIIGQCVLARYDPSSLMASAAMQESRARLVERIARTPGNVLVLEHPYYALLAGKPPGVALTALWHARAQGAQPLPVDLIERIRSKYYAAIIADEGTYPEVEADLDAELQRAYRLNETLDSADAPPTLSGVIVRPARIYTPQ